MFVSKWISLKDRFVCKYGGGIMDCYNVKYMHVGPSMIGLFQLKHEKGLGGLLKFIYFFTKLETILDFPFLVRSKAINSFQIIYMHIE
jgi:hypothetical protein